MAASQPPSWPAHTWSGPAAVWMSSLSTLRIALAMILLCTSPMPIGRTPGHLSRGINLHATKALRYAGLIGAVHRCFPTLARAEQRSVDALNEQQRLLHAAASKPDMPAAPFAFWAALRIISLFNSSKRIGFADMGRPCNRLLGEAAFPGGCFSINISRTVRVAPVWDDSGIMSSRPRTPLEEEEDSILNALFVFPVDISF